MTEGRRFVVVRGTGTRVDGRWYDLDVMPERIPDGLGQRFKPTNRYERREDGMSARVYVPEPAWESPLRER